ncbi:MAG: hypothetical protein M1814_001149 [Vezdaea aestivalis]|nr:MAG: hypothetical protein M1814_001149 [Vezdaea aestivalis]
MILFYLIIFAPFSTPALLSPARRPLPSPVINTPTPTTTRRRPTRSELRAQRAYAQANPLPGALRPQAPSPVVETIHPQFRGLPIYDGLAKFDAQIYCHVGRIPTAGEYGLRELAGQIQEEDRRNGRYDGIPDTDSEGENEDLRTLQDLERQYGLEDAISGFMDLVASVEYTERRERGEQEAGASARPRRTRYAGDGIWPPRRNPADYTSLLSLCWNKKNESPPGLGCRCLRPGFSSIVVCDEADADPRLFRSTFPEMCQLSCYCRVWAVPRRPDEPGAYLLNIQPGVNMDSRSGGMVIYYENDNRGPEVIKEPVGGYYKGTDFARGCGAKCARHGDCSVGGQGCRCVVGGGQVGAAVGGLIKFFAGHCGILGPVTGLDKKRKRDKDDGGKKVDLMCPCNQTYVSQACCFQELVWEDPQHKTGEMVESDDLISSD